MTTMDQAYAECRRIHRRYGVTSYWATRTLAAVKRPHVDAVYAFFRRTDDSVDLGSCSMEERARQVAALETGLLGGLEGKTPEDPVVLAMAHTARAFRLSRETFDRFFAGMRMDLAETGFETFAMLAKYIDGVSVTLGEMLMPILEAEIPGARGHGRDLAFAAQLTNMIRDVSEDLDRGRIYIPQEEIDRFGADPASRLVTPEWRELMRFQIARTRGYYAAAEEGISRLPGRTAACLRAGADAYSRILDRIEANDYDVFSGRAVVPFTTKLGVTAKHAALVALGR